MRANGLQDKSLYDYNFVNDNGYNPEIQKAHDYVAHWEEMKDKSLGLLFWGDVGTGKSFLAGCIANALLDKGIPVLMTNFSRIMNTLTGMYPDDRNRFIDSFNQYSLLIIDDLGTEAQSSVSLQFLFELINKRILSNKKMIISTNLNMSEITKRYTARIASRVYESFEILNFKGRDIRIQKLEKGNRND